MRNGFHSMAYGQLGMTCFWGAAFMALVQLLLCLSILCGQLVAQDPSKGLYPDTRLEAPTNLTPIKDLEPGSQVLACQEGQPTVVQVTATREQEAEQLTLLALDQEFVVCGPDQPFLASHGQWLLAKDLTAGDKLATASGQSVEVKFTKTYSMPGRLHQLSVEHPHNYCVGQSGLVAKNIGLVSAWASAKLSGEAFLAIEGASLGPSFFLGPIVGAALGVASIVGTHYLQERRRKKELSKTSIAQERDYLLARELVETKVQDLCHSFLTTLEYAEKETAQPDFGPQRASSLCQLFTDIYTGIERGSWRALDNYRAKSEIGAPEEARLRYDIEKILQRFRAYTDSVIAGIQSKVARQLSESRGLPTNACQPETLRPEPKTVGPCLPEQAEIRKPQQCGQGHTLKLEDGPCCGSIQRHELQDPVPCGTAANSQDPDLLASPTCGGAKAQELYERGQLSLRKQREKARGSGDFEPSKKDEEAGELPSPKVDNMEELLEKTPLGRILKGRVEKTKIIKSGQAVYRTTEKIPELGLKKDCYFYIDKKHRDEIEVFKGCEAKSKGVAVIKTNGKKNLIKSEKAKRERYFGK